MLRFTADENFNGNIVRGLRRRNPSLDIVRLQDIGLTGASDDIVLEWTANEGCILLTHDVSTISQYAYERVEARKVMTGVFEISQDMPVGQAIEEILLIAECSLEDEWNNQIRYLPLR